MVDNSNLRTDLTIPEDLLNSDHLLLDRLSQAQFHATELAPSPRDRRAKTPRNSKNIIQFFEVLLEAFNDKLTREGISSDLRPRLIEEFPPQDMTTEVITWKISKREPGQISAGPIGADSARREYRPTFRELVDSEDPGYKDIIAGQWFDNTIIFTCWAKTNKVANYRALWFEEFMAEYNWFFQYSGLPRGVIFLERLEDKKDEQASNKLVKRELKYYLRTERLYTISQKTLTELVVRLYSSEVGSTKKG